jgi:Arc/MetJ-type ribon-helix-helix transcriptional regulator
MTIGEVDTMWSWYDTWSYRRWKVARAKIAVSLSKSTVETLDRLVEDGVYPSRSRAIQEALDERLERLTRDRLARECAKLEPSYEAAFSEEGMDTEVDQWPEY